MNRFVSRFISSLLGGAVATTGLLVGFAAQAEPCSQRSASVNAQATQTGNIVDVAAADASFSTLVKAVQAAGLVDVLSGEGPFTVFAPTNEAFAALPSGTLDRLLEPENRDALRKVLTYHVVPGSLPSRDLSSGDVATVEGETVNVQIKDGRVQVNDSNVVSADIQASNGVIHVIDRVLLPPNL